MSESDQTWSPNKEVRAEVQRTLWHPRWVKAVCNLPKLLDSQAMLSLTGSQDSRAIMIADSWRQFSLAHQCCGPVLGRHRDARPQDDGLGEGVARRHALQLLLKASAPRHLSDGSVAGASLTENGGGRCAVVITTSTNQHIVLQRQGLRCSMPDE